MAPFLSLDQFYDKAWGHVWPHHEGRVSIADIGLPINTDLDDVFNFPVQVDDHFDYTCYEDLDDIYRLLHLKKSHASVLIVRPEYDLLRMAIESDSQFKNAFVVTGHPGIGKTIFLLYLLLYRLQRCLPTAVQFDNHRYFLFDKHGALARSVVDLDEPRILQCWALADSNSNVSQPCLGFQSDAKLVIQASSPKPSRWKEWLKQAEGGRLYSELPTILEIAAILKEFCLDPSSTFPLMSRWGPSTRSITDIAIAAACGRGWTVEEELEADANGAAIQLCSSPSLVSLFASNEGVPGSEGSSVRFVRPCRSYDNTAITSSRAISFIPTKFLDNLFAAHCTEFTNQKCLDLFKAFSSNSLTRTAAAWGFEIRVHKHLYTAGVDLDIFGADGLRMKMRPSPKLVPGTAAGLKSTSARDSFYWMPSVMNFPGIDGVLGDTEGNIFAVQTTIADDHRTPDDGLRRTWKELEDHAREGRTWHLVVVGDTPRAVNGLVAKFSRHLEHFTLGLSRVHVQVWGYVLPFSRLM